MKTLLVVLISSDKSKVTREGAIRGLVGIGKEAIRKGLVEGGGVKVVGSECMPRETGHSSYLSEHQTHTIPCFIESPNKYRCCTLDHS